MRDLHIHLDGSLSISAMLKIAAEEGISLPKNFREEVQYNSASGTLADYLKCFSLPLELLRTPDAVRYSVISLINECQAEKIDYIEIRFAPQLHLGGTQEEVLQAAIEGLSFCELVNVKAGLILCLMRGMESEKGNETTLDLAEKYLGKGVCALDLAGNEAAYPVTMYSDYFNYAKKKGIPFTIHAGEAAGPESIEEALKLGASRIGHGIAAARDESLMKYLAEHEIPLEMCPTSNLQTGAVKNLDEYPLKKFLDKGIVATVNTDNKTVSNTKLSKEFELVSALPGITETDIMKLKANAVKASFTN